jgi:hypothetical protein
VRERKSFQFGGGAKKMNHMFDKWPFKALSVGAAASNDEVL